MEHHRLGDRHRNYFPDYLLTSVTKNIGVGLRLNLELRQKLSTGFCALMFLLIFTLPAAAQSDNTALRPLVLSSQTATYTLDSSVRLFSETSQQATLSDLARQYQRREGTPVSERAIVLPADENPHWVIFSAINQDRFNREWLLSLGDLFEGTYGSIERLELYDTATPQTPVVTDGRSVLNKIQQESQRKNIVPLALPINQLRIFALRIETSPGTTVRFTPRLLTNTAYEQEIKQQRGRDLTLAAIAILFVVLAGFIAILTEKNIAFAFIPYIALMFPLIQTQDTLISYGNNTLAVLLPLLIYGLIGSKLLLSSLIGFNQDQVILRRLSYFGFFAMVGLGIFYSLPANASAPLSDAVFTFIPLILLCLAFAASVTIFMTTESRGAGILLVLSTVLLGGAGGFVYLFAGQFSYWPYIYIGLLAAQLASFLGFGYVRLNEVRTAEQANFEERRKKQVYEQKLREQQKSSDQEKLVSILQRERELLGELKEREAERAQAMRSAKEVADEANRAKSAFLAVISHEIRTPMTGIMGMVRLLLDTELEKQQKEYAQTIQYSGDALLALLNDILDFSKIEEGRMEIETMNFDLNRMIESVIMLMSGRAKERNITLESEISPNAPPYLKGDPTRIRQVLLNLVGNAVKFTENGGVTVIVKCDEAKEGHCNLYFGVKDTGIGITPEAQRNLFNPFSQADSTISRRFGGTGLGLAICKRLVTAMGGEIKIDSTPGQGSLFHFTLPMPIGAAPENDAASEHERDIPSLSIMVADDNNINQKVLIGLLSKDGHKVTAVNDGLEAYQKVQDAHFDLILMDMEMPVMTGIESTVEIRSLTQAEKAHIPIIAMTANVMKEDIERCQMAGMNEYISKPIDPENLRSIIARVAHKEGAFKASRRSADPIRTEIDPDMQARNPEPPRRRASDRAMETSTSEDAPAAPEEDPAAKPSTTYQRTEKLELDNDRNAAEQAPANMSPDAGLTALLFDEDMLGNLKSSLGADALDEMMQDLYSKSEELITAAEEALEKQDYEALRGRAHDLKGMTSNFGLTGISDTAGPIEKGARDQQDFETLAPQVKKLRPNYDKLREQLDEWFKT